MKRMILLVCIILPLCVSANAWSPMETDSNHSGWFQCFITTAASDDSGKDEDNNKSKEEEEPDCD